MTHCVRAPRSLTVALSVLLGVPACGGGGSTGSGETGGAPKVITADGSSTVAPVTEAVAEEFQKVNAGTR